MLLLLLLLHVEAAASTCLLHVIRLVMVMLNDGEVCMDRVYVTTLA